MAQLMTSSRPLKRRGRVTISPPEAPAWAAGYEQAVGEPLVLVASCGPLRQEALREPEQDMGSPKVGEDGVCVEVLGGSLPPHSSH